MLRDLVQDLRVAGRAYAARPAFASIAVLTVALAIGANAVVFGMLRGVLFRPLPYGTPDRIVTIWPDHFFSYRDLLFLREHATSYSDIAAWVPGWNMTLTGRGDAAKLRGARVTANIFSVLGVVPATGRDFTTDEEAPGSDGVVVLSSGLWRTRFGADSGIVGRRLVLDGAPHTVAGVMPAGFELYQPQTQVWRVLAANPDEWYYRGNALFAIGRLRPGVSVDDARAEVRLLVGQMRQAFGLPADFGAGADVTPFKAWLTGPIRPLLSVAYGAVGFVLLLAGANLANLLLARAAGREREIAVRTALGASRGRLIRQLLAESGLLAVTGGLGGLFLARWGFGLAESLLPVGTPFASRVGVDPVVLVVSGVLILGVGTVFGLAPALTAARIEPQQALRGTRGSGVGPTGRRSRAVLVTGEVAISMMLLVGAALMTQTLWRLQRVDPGFRMDGVLTLGVQPTGAGFREAARRVSYYEAVFARLRSLRTVVSVGAIQHLPLAGTGWGADLEIEGRTLAPGAAPPRAAWRIVAGDYFQAMGIPILAGRSFIADDRSGTPPEVIVNRTMARRFWPGESALGHRIRAGEATSGGWATIVGVVGDVRHDGLNTAPVAELYQPFAQNPLGGMTLVVHTGADPRLLAPAVVDAVGSLERDVPITLVRPMDEVAAASVADRRTVLLLLGSFAFVGFILGIGGTYGVVSHYVEARSREIGIRIAIGAAPRSVVAASLGEGLRLGTVGIALGLAGALVVDRWLATFVFEVGTGDPATLVAVAALLLVGTALASFLPARRAARIDPMSALRAE